ncbi:RBR-type E3 ubiquitin transferase [Ranunculus cassubicifolius]
MSFISTIKPCNHSYCSDCISKYVDSKIVDNVDTIKCPNTNCSSSLELEFCGTFLPENVYNRWCRLLCESSISGAQNLYCPFKDCSALLIDDGDGITDSECSYCHRLFCAQCKVPWHSGFTCEEFHELPESEKNVDDIKLMDLAKNKNWQRCPKCKFYVEKIDGCTYMVCRCGFGFCYKCGDPVGAGHVACNCTRNSRIE